MPDHPPAYTATPAMTTDLEKARELFLQGVARFEAGELEAAREAFSAALIHAPGRPSVLGNLGITLYRLGRPEDAVPLLQQATAADPDYADAWTCLGLSLTALARWQEAADTLQQASAQSPRNAELQVRLSQCLLRLGQAPEAMQALDRAIEIDPRHAHAWTLRGNLLRETQQFEAAAACFEQALALGADPALTGYYLASVRGSAAPHPPRSYVEALFDEYAEEFQSHVVDQLRYQGYKFLLQPFQLGQRRFRHALDLGCGTGLCGPQLQPLVEVLDGVDLSQAMLAQARQLGIYRELIHADIGEYLATADCQADLVLAADVFIYVGELDAVFREVRRLLAPGGCFAFTVEAPTEDVEWQLLPSLRYAHSEPYIRRLADAHGFKVERMARAPIRYDQDQPLAGLYFYLG